MPDLEFLFQGELSAARCEKSGDGYKVTVGEREFEFVPAGDDLYSVFLNGRRCVIGAAEYKGKFYIDIDSVLLEVAEPSEEAALGGAGGEMGEKDKILAPMPGKIVKIQVEVGQQVPDRHPMVIVEAMKMENQVLSQAAGTVKAINFAEGDQVDTETPIIELEVEE